MVNRPENSDRESSEGVRLPDYLKSVAISVNEASPVGVRISLVEGSESRHQSDFVEGKLKESRIEVATKKSEFPGVRNVVIASRKLVRDAMRFEAKKIVVPFQEFRAKTPVAELSDRKLGEILGENMTMAAYDFSMYRTKGKQVTMELISITGASAEAKVGIERGMIIGRETNFARDLVNMPPKDLYPATFAEATQKQFEGTEATVTVYSHAQLKEMGMGLIDAVGKGAEHEPKFVVVEYWGAGKGKQKATGLIGKGITMDTGGYNVKTAGMVHMHHDMQGGAATFAAVASLAKLKERVNVIAIVPMADNRIDSKAFVPSDIIKAKNGETVSIEDTDAEGRLVLADAMTYLTEKYDAESIVTTATLTGAVAVAVGKEASLILTKSDSLATSINIASRLSGTPVARLDVTSQEASPEVGADWHWKQKEDALIKQGNSRGADITHAMPSDIKPRVAGAFFGAVFINHFARRKNADGSVKEFDHVHIDMAPRADSHPEEFLSGPSSGEPTSLLVNYVLDRQKRQLN